MLEDARKEVRLAFLEQGRTRLREIMDVSRDYEATLLKEGKNHDEYMRQRDRTLQAKSELDEIESQIRALKESTA